MKKSERVSLRETLEIHFRAAKDVSRVAPGVFLPAALSSVFKAITPYTNIWLSARLINELATFRRMDVLVKWALLTVVVTAAMGLIRSALERWNAAQAVANAHSLLDKTVKIGPGAKHIRR